MLREGMGAELLFPNASVHSRGSSGKSADVSHRVMHLFIYTIPNVSLLVFIYKTGQCIRLSTWILQEVCWYPLPGQGYVLGFFGCYGFNVLSYLESNFEVIITMGLMRWWCPEDGALRKTTMEGTDHFGFSVSCHVKSQVLFFGDRASESFWMGNSVFKREVSLWSPWIRMSLINPTSI